MCLRIPHQAASYYRRARIGEMQGQSPEEYRSAHGNVREDFRRAITQKIAAASGGKLLSAVKSAGRFQCIVHRAQCNGFTLYIVLCTMH